MKKTFKKIVVAVLGWQVRNLRKKRKFKIIGVAGSIGKTSTKLAIAQTLSKTLRVRWQDGNYNDSVSVPLIFFGHDMPGLTNPIGWLKIFISNFRQLFKDYPYDVVVVELATDRPGQIAEFKKYLRLDIAVVTSIAPEHMEYFTDLKAVADEEFSVAEYSDKLFYNIDLVAPELRHAPEGAVSYGMTNQEADFYLANIYNSVKGIEGDVKHNGQILAHVSQEVISETQLYSTLASVAVGHELGLKPTQILSGINAIMPVSGRLRRLRGINNSTIIDDTYNSSPEAVKAGLQTIYKMEAPQKIAILGSMNELGTISAEAHREIGEFCDPSKLSLLITIGKEANTFLAPVAENKGCQVKSFDSPYDAGDYLQAKIEPGAVILAKGSQNGVFAEEAVKKILADPEDAVKLVRQSGAWAKKKAAQFKPV